MALPTNPDVGDTVVMFNRTYIFAEPAAPGPGVWRVAVSQNVGEGEAVIPPSYTFTSEEPAEVTSTLTDPAANIFTVNTSLDIESLDEKS